MEVILLSDVEKLGLRGDVVDVAPGYARNFLVPRRLAERATPSKVAELARRDEQRARHEARTEEQAQQVADLLGKTVLRFEVRAGPTGALFGSVTPTDIADEIWRTRKVRVDRRKIALAEPIKRIGRFSVPIGVFGEVTAEVKTLVVPEGGELPPEEELAALEAAEAAAAAPPAEEAPVEYLEDEPSAAEGAGERLDDAPPADTRADGGEVVPADGLEPGAEPGPGPDVPDDAFDRAVDAADPDQDTP